MDEFKLHRNFLKDSLRKTIDFSASAQHRGVPIPPLQEPVDQQLPRIKMPPSAWSGNDSTV